MPGVGIELSHGGRSSLCLDTVQRDIGFHWHGLSPVTVGLIARICTEERVISAFLVCVDSLVA